MSFTAAAVMQLSERGQLDLDAPIGAYLRTLSPDLQGLTLRQLLSHTSRAYDSPFDFQDRFFGEQVYTSQMIMDELVPNICMASPDSPDQVSYGNYLLAGLIVENVSGLSYGDYLNQYVFPPAGLQHTSCCLQPPAEMARGYIAQDNGFQPLQLNASAVFAAGGLCSTAGDLLLWMDALTSGKVVSPDSFRQMLAPSGFQGGSSQLSMGYGLYTLSTDYGQQIGYSGFEASYVSNLISYPEKGLTIVLLSNTGNSGSDLLPTLQAYIPYLLR